MKNPEPKFIPLNLDQPIWDHFYMVAPLVLIGSKEGDVGNLAPKHMATALGYSNFFGFVCTPRHSTYRNIQSARVFTVSFPRPEQIVATSLSATTRGGDDILAKPVLQQLPLEAGQLVSAPLLTGAAIHLECELDRIIDDFGENSLITGKIIRAAVHPDYHRKEDIDSHEQIFEHPLLAYLAYGRFATIKDTHAFPFPKQFKI
jgi:flavin reductase (DIM6/NTAB) family NADH-FMN oxidoreductase RutF